MGKNTAISWTDHTWNPWVGCHKVGQGCKNCYMFRGQERYGADPNVVRRTSPATFGAPLTWKDPAMVFTCNWSDFFIEEADEWREEAWEIIEVTPHLTYQILTKRPFLALNKWPKRWGKMIPNNVWLGTTVEEYDEFFRHFPMLGVLKQERHAPVVFISCEPLLSAIDIRFQDDLIDWVIVGGESGPGARPMNLDWARSLRDQCADAGIPFFFKQVGGNRKIDGVWGGDLLDGKQYHEFPQEKG